MLETASQPRTIETSPLPQGLDLELLRLLFLARELNEGARASISAAIAAALALDEADRFCATGAYADAHLARGLERDRIAELPATSDVLALAAGIAFGAQLQRIPHATLAAVPAPGLAGRRARQLLGLAVDRALPLVVLAAEEPQEVGAVDAALPLAASLGLDVEVLATPAPETAFAAVREGAAHSRGGGGPKLILVAAGDEEEEAGWDRDARPADPLASYVRRLLAHGHRRARVRELRNTAELEAQFS